MDLFLAHILDIIPILIVIAAVLIGRRRGFIRMLLSLVGFLAAAALATFVSNASYEYVYDNAVKPSVMKVVEEKADELAKEYNSEEVIAELFGGDSLSDFLNNSEYADSLLTESDFRDKINSMFTEYCTRLTESLSGVLPDEIAESAQAYLSEISIIEDKSFAKLQNGEASAAGLIEENVIRPVMLITVKNVIFALTFAAACIVISILIRLVGIMRRAEVIRVPDSFLGGILGFIYAVLIIMALSLLCSFFIKLTGDENAVVNSEVISGTYFFKYIYSGAFWLLSLILK